MATRPAGPPKQPTPHQIATHWLSLLGLMLVLLLPTLDHHAVERFPSHSHMLLQGGLTQHTYATLAHKHRFEQAHGHTTGQRQAACAKDYCSRDLPGIISTHHAEGAGVSSFSWVLLPPSSPMPQPPAEAVDSLVQPYLQYWETSPDPLDPPPRPFA